MELIKIQNNKKDQCETNIKLDTKDNFVLHTVSLNGIVKVPYNNMKLSNGLFVVKNQQTRGVNVPGK